MRSRGLKSTDLLPQKNGSGDQPYIIRVEGGISGQGLKGTTAVKKAQFTEPLQCSRLRQAGGGGSLPEAGDQPADGLSVDEEVCGLERGEAGG